MKNKKNLELPGKNNFSRRSFITKTTLAAVGTIGTVNALTSCKSSMPKRKEEKLPALPDMAPEGKLLKAGLIGCGGRGTGAALNWLDAGPNLEIVALGDVFKERIDKCRSELKGTTLLIMTLKRCSEFTESISPNWFLSAPPIIQLVIVLI